MSKVTELKSRPLSDLEEEIIEPSKNFTKVEPVYLRKLATRMKANEIAEAIGYTPSGVSSILNGDGDCRKVVEMACELIWQTTYGEIAKVNATKPVCAFVTGDLKLMKMIQSMVDIGAGGFAFIELPK